MPKDDRPTPTPPAPPLEERLKDMKEREMMELLVAASVGLQGHALLEYVDAVGLELRRRLAQQ